MFRHRGSGSVEVILNLDGVDLVFMENSKNKSDAGEINLNRVDLSIKATICLPMKLMAGVYNNTIGFVSKRMILIFLSQVDLLF